MTRAVALLACLWGVASCIIDSNEKGSGAHLMVTWGLASLATSTTAPCPAGFDTAAVYSQPVDDNGSNNGAATIDLFNCSDGYGLTSALDIEADNLYAETVSIATDDNSTVYGSTVPVQVTVGDQVQEVDTPPVYVDGGHFSLTWQLMSGSGSGAAVVTCDQVPAAASIGVTATAGSAAITSPPIACSAPIGYTAGIPSGDWIVAVALLDAGGNAIGSSAPISASITTSATQGNPIVVLPEVTIDIAP